MGPDEGGPNELVLASGDLVEHMACITEIGCWKAQDFGGELK